MRQRVPLLAVKVACRIGIWSDVNGKRVGNVVDGDGGDGSTGDMADERDCAFVCFLLKWPHACVFTLSFMIHAYNSALFFLDVSDVGRGGWLQSL